MAICISCVRLSTHNEDSLKCLSRPSLLSSERINLLSGMLAMNGIRSILPLVCLRSVIYSKVNPGRKNQAQLINRNQYRKSINIILISTDSHQSHRKIIYRLKNSDILNMTMLFGKQHREDQLNLNTLFSFLNKQLLQVQSSLHSIFLFLWF